MKSIFIFLIFSFAFEVIVAQSNCTDSEAQGLRKCWTDYLNNFGYNYIPSNDNYIQKDISYLSANGPAGFNKQCEWVKARNACEQPYLADCGDAAGYSMALNDTAVDAGKYIAADAVELWECTDGYNLSMNNFYCIISVDSNHFLDIEFCQLKLAADLLNATDCKPATSYVECIMGVYKKYCGDQGSIFGCYWGGIPMQIAFPACDAALPSCGDSSKEVDPFHNPSAKKIDETRRFYRGKQLHRFKKLM
ncbi:hypothetical protein FO519_007972 [Halicephalobus sp. NKZ332]|nr:hypothetical protein FO519_007972 [Halicephalobus sp. NKZ332]